MLNDKEGMVEMEEKEGREWNTRTYHAEGGVLKGRKAGGEGRKAGGRGGRQGEERKARGRGGRKVES